MTGIADSLKKDYSWEKDKLYIEYLYKEYSRIHELSDTYAKSSFDDFKLLIAGCGAILAWKPIAVNFLDGDLRILFIGFLAILFFVAIVGTRDLLKQSILIFYMRQLEYYESSIRSFFEKPDQGTFSLSLCWNIWFRKKHRFVGIWFYILFFIFVALYPTVVICTYCTILFGLIYFVVSIITSLVSFIIIRILYHS